LLSALRWVARHALAPWRWARVLRQWCPSTAWEPGR